MNAIFHFLTAPSILVGLAIVVGSMLAVAWVESCDSE